MRMERWRYTVPLRLKSLFLRRRVERELDEELQFHLEHKIEEGLAQGLPADEARYRALRAMDGLAQQREHVRDTWRMGWLTDLTADFRYAVRSLRRTPALTGFVVLTLALGVGMTATPFSMLDALVFRPYPVADPGSVVNLFSTSRDSRWDAFSYREYLDVRDRTNSYDGVVASLPLGAAGYSARAGVTPVVRGVMPVSGNYFQVLGVEPRIGRGFRPDEDTVPGRDAVVVLAPGFWQREFAGDPSVVGRTIRLNGKDFTVIGVAPESFPGMLIFGRPDLYVPLAMARLFTADARQDLFEDRDFRGLTVRGRLKSGVTTRQARTELAALAGVLAREYPKFNRDRGTAVLTQFEMRTRDDDVNWKFSVIFTMLAVGVLLVACTNAASLLLSRARTRKREIAVRLAMGAGRFRLIRLLLTESLVLAVLGGAGGVAVGYLGIQLLRRFQIPADLPVSVPFRMDERVLVASLAAALVCALACGLAPALQSTKTDLVNGLKTADVDLPGRKKLWGRNALVVAQVALSLMLLAASFLMVRGFRNSLEEGIGYPKERLLMVRFDPRLMQFTVEQTQQFYRQLTERARSLGGARAVGLTQNPPLGLDDFDTVEFVPEGFQMPRDRQSFRSAMDTVDEGFFETMGVTILAGRGFTASDRAGSAPVAVVNEHLARRYWPGQDVIGKTIRVSGQAVRIVGMAQTLKYRVTFEKPEDFIYLPLAQHAVARMVLLVRTAGDPLQLVAPVEEMVRKLDANMPILETRSYESLYRYAAVEGPGVAINMVGTFGAVGLVLAMAGLYGLVAYNVSRRTREIGIRMAIGASPRDVMRLMMGKGLMLVGIGTVIGLGLGFAVERMMNAMLFHAGGVDVAAYLVVVPLLLAVTTLAAYVPARSAARIAPTQALRQE